MSGMTLYNCLGRDIFVEVDGQPVALERVPTPILLQPEHQAVGLLPVQTQAGLVELEVFEWSSPSSVAVGLPDFAEGVFYLVDEETLAHFAHREDFVAPAQFKGNHGHRLGEGPRSFLCAVTRQVKAAASNVLDVSAMTVHAAES